MDHGSTSETPSSMDKGPWDLMHRFEIWNLKNNVMV